MRKLALIVMFLVAAPFVGEATGAQASESTTQCTILGTARADKILGTPGKDVICAGTGHDVIYGLGGNDVVLGGPGNDQIFGGSGNDFIYGEAGNDSASGEDGADTIFGGAGRDSLSGASGNDMLKGDDSSDNISGGVGNDMIDGGVGRDTIRTGTGKDICSEDASDSRLDGCTIDGTAPVFGPMTMDVKQFRAGETAVFTFTVVDASGVQSIAGFIGGAPGWVTNWCGFGFEAELVEGTARSGTYEIRCDIPSDAVNEDYSLFLSTSDVFGNAGKGPSIAFQVFGGSSDNKVPTVSDIQLPEMAKPGDNVTIEVSVTDDSGVAGIYCWFMLDGGGFSDGKIIYSMATGESRLTSGTTKSGFLAQEIAFDVAAPEGTYTLWLSIKDLVGNRDFYSTGKTIKISR